MSKKYFFLLLLILLDLGYSFVQHYHISLDGDMAPIVVPGEWYRQVLEDPFGWSVLTEQQSYGGAGRFFCHFSMSWYYNHVPVWLQSIVSPIDSVYLSTALIKTAVQGLLIWLLAVFISGRAYVFDRRWILAALLVTPFFQTHGYNGIIAIVERAPTYFFFYSLPAALLLLFYLPFFRSSFFKKNKNRMLPGALVSLLLVPFLPFSGPLTPAVVLLLSGMIVLRHLWGKISSQKDDAPVFTDLATPEWVLLGVVTLVSLYSFYIGRFNAENTVVEAGFAERYIALFKGLCLQLTQKLALPVLLAAIAFNYLWVGRKPVPEQQKIITLMRYVFLFILLYLLLLPLGGFRSYRTLIIRHDTMIPVTLGLVYLFGISTYYLLRTPRNKHRKMYGAGVVVVLLIFTFADLPNLDHNNCERRALETIAASRSDTVRLEENCPVLYWDPMVSPKDSYWNAQLIKRWGITDEVRMYYQGNGNGNGN